MPAGTLVADVFAYAEGSPIAKSEIAEATASSLNNLGSVMVSPLRKICLGESVKQRLSGWQVEYLARRNSPLSGPTEAMRSRASFCRIDLYPKGHLLYKRKAAPQGPSSKMRPSSHLSGSTCMPGLFHSCASADAG